MAVVLPTEISFQVEVSILKDPRSLGSNNENEPRILECCMTNLQATFNCPVPVTVSAKAKFLHEITSDQLRWQ